jgi:hypothetical protein
MSVGDEVFAENSALGICTKFASTCWTCISAALAVLPSARTAQHAPIKCEILYRIVNPLFYLAKSIHSLRQSVSSLKTIIGVRRSTIFLLPLFRGGYGIYHSCYSVFIRLVAQEIIVFNLMRLLLRCKMSERQFEEYRHLICRYILTPLLGAIGFQQIAHAIAFLVKKIERLLKLRPEVLSQDFARAATITTYRIFLSVLRTACLATKFSISYWQTARSRGDFFSLSVSASACALCCYCVRPRAPIVRRRAPGRHFECAHPSGNVRLRAHHCRRFRYAL